MRKLIAAFCILLFFLLIPKLFSEYWIYIAIEILIMGFFAMSFNLLMGYSGLLSFGHAGFFGVSAYITALLIQHGCNSIMLILFFSMVASFICSVVIGYLSVRQDEIYFAMITLGFGMMLYTIAHNWTEVTGGSDGLPLSNIPSIMNFSLIDPVNLYYFTLIIVGIGVFILWRLVTSPFGLILKGMRENKNRLNFSGGNISAIRLFAFTISGTLSGVAGFLFCIFSNMATPEFLHWSFSAKPVLMAIIGGAWNFFGPMIGAMIFFALEQFIKMYTENWMIFLGILLVPITIFFPKGVLGTIYEYFERKYYTKS